MRKTTPKYQEAQDKLDTIEVILKLHRNGSGVAPKDMDLNILQEHFEWWNDYLDNGYIDQSSAEEYSTGTIQSMGDWK